MDGENSLFSLSGFLSRDSQLLHFIQELLNQEAKREANSTKMGCQKTPTLLLFMQKHEFIQYHSKKDIIYNPCVNSMSSAKDKVIRDQALTMLTCSWEPGREEQ